MMGSARVFSSRADIDDSGEMQECPLQVDGAARLARPLFLVFAKQILFLQFLPVISGWIEPDRAKSLVTVSCLSMLSQ